VSKDYVLPEDPDERAAFLAEGRAAYEASRLRKGLPIKMPKEIMEEAADYMILTGMLKRTPGDRPEEKA
jgi:hypothetical protein